MTILGKHCDIERELRINVPIEKIEKIKNNILLTSVAVVITTKNYCAVPIIADIESSRIFGITKFQWKRRYAGSFEFFHIN